MNNMNIKNEIERILSPYIPAGVDYVRGLEDQGVDSLSTIDIVLAIEEVFDIELPDDEFNPENFFSAESLVKMVDRIVEL